MLRKKTAWRATLSLILSQVNRCVVIATNGERRTEQISSRRVGTMNAMDIAAHLIAELVRLDLEMGDGCWQMSASGSLEFYNQQIQIKK